MKALEFGDLVQLVARLRAADGCPWDRRQQLIDLRAYVIEEAHEVAAAIDSGDWSELGAELGDLLFQVAFITRLGQEQGLLEPEDVVRGIHAKMVARHPHVFGGEKLATSEDVQQAWEQNKAKERSDQRRGGSHLDGVPTSLPALVGAYRLGQKAGGVGFDWSDPAPVLDKVREELAEVAEAGDHPDRSFEEIGDLLFAIASYARHRRIDPEAALAAANAKFRRRFSAMEQLLAPTGRPLAQLDPAELNDLWEQVKRAQ